MKKKGSKRMQIKRLRFQTKQAFNSQKDPCYLLNTLQKLEAGPQVEKPHTYHLIPLNVKIDYPDYQDNQNRSSLYYLQTTVLFPESGSEN